MDTAPITYELWKIKFDMLLRKSQDNIVLSTQKFARIRIRMINIS